MISSLTLSGPLPHLSSNTLILSSLWLGSLIDDFNSTEALIMEG